eukprot:comp8103_c0_seq1/m.3586 comp8103_c0_seq1/g.3586  ORF comp8103_c0_seq1/g.3586 comp8103_c0_seq1/m.3586 type:complete len:190 (-) comp8103_c0_seq1:20-589(-)
MLRRRKNVGPLREEPKPSSRSSQALMTEQSHDSSSDEDITRSSFLTDNNDHTHELLDDYRSPGQGLKRGLYTFAGARRRKEMRQRDMETSSDSDLSSDELVFTEGEEESDENFSRYMARGRKSRLYGRAVPMFDLPQDWERDIETPYRRQNRLYVLLGAILLMIGFRVLRVAVTAWGRAQKQAANKEKL